MASKRVGPPHFWLCANSGSKLLKLRSVLGPFQGLSRADPRSELGIPEKRGGPPRLHSAKKGSGIAHQGIRAFGTFFIESPVAT